MTLKRAKAIEYGLYFLAFFLPWQTRWIFRPGFLAGGESQYTTYSLYASDTLILALLVLGGLEFCRAWRAGWRPRNRWVAAAVLAFLLWAAASATWASDWRLAVYAFLNLAAAAGLAGLAAAFADRQRLAWGLVLGLILPAWLAVGQFLYQGSFAQKWLGLAKHDPIELGQAVIEVYPSGQLPERWLRAYGSFDHPNILGGSMAVGLLLALWLLTKQSAQPDKERPRQLLYLAIASLAAALLVSFSRAAWLAALAGFAAGGLAYAWPRQRLQLRAWLGGAGLALAIFGLMLLPYRSLVSARLSGAGRLEQKSLSERFDGYAQFGQIMSGHWFGGVGVGNYVPALAALEPGQPAWQHQPVHNAFLLALGELGTLGLVLSVWALTVLFWAKLNEPLIYVMAAALAIIMLSDHWLWSLHFGRLFLFSCLAVLVAADSKK